MGRFLLVCRLAARDAARRRAETVLLLLAIAAATTTLTLGLVLHGVTSQPYQRTRAATSGPDVVASFANLPPMPGQGTPAAALAAMTALTRAPGVTGHSGPYPVSWATVRAHGLTAGTMAEGRSTASAAIDQPKLTEGGWVRPGQAVIEQSFAQALGVHPGDRITLNGRSFRVAGIAVTAANSAYPSADVTFGGSAFPTPDCGMLWLTEPDARSLVTRALPISYTLNLRLVQPAAAAAFALRYGSAGQVGSLLNLASWQSIQDVDSRIVQNDQLAFLVGSWLLGVLAIASVAVVVGGRITDQRRRVGLLKAVGGTPRLVAGVFLAEYLVIALAAGAVGLAAGWLVGPLLASPGAGLIGTPGAPVLTWTTVGLVTGLALAVALAATLVPAVRAGRTSTVTALADAARRPKRRALLIKASRRLPVPLLLGLRLAARRPRRMVLMIASVAITVMTIVTVLTVHEHQASAQGLGGLSTLANPRYQRVDQVLLVITIVMVILAAVNAIFITHGTALDARRSLAVARSLGATPGQVSAGLSAAQLAPALPGALLGIPLGLGLVTAVRHGESATSPSVWSLIEVVLGVMIVVAALTAVPARISARRPTAEILQSELV